MFDSTFFKFLIVFILIIAASFLIMGIVGGYNDKTSINFETPKIAVK